MLMRSGFPTSFANQSHMAHIVTAVQGADVTILVNLLAPDLHAKHAVLQHSHGDVRASC